MDSYKCKSMVSKICISSFLMYYKHVDVTASSEETASWLSSRGLSLANNSAATPFTLTGLS